MLDIYHQYFELGCLCCILHLNLEGSFKLIRLGCSRWSVGWRRGEGGVGGRLRLEASLIGINLYV